MKKNVFCFILVIIVPFIIIYLLFNMCKNIKIEHEDFIMDKPLWSKGPIQSSYSNMNTETISNTQYLIRYMKKCKEILWIRNGSHSKNTQSDLDKVANNLDFLTNPVILITSDGDRSVPSSYKDITVKRLLESPKIIKWFTQNYDVSIKHPKLNHIPIGFDLHTTKWKVGNSQYDKLKFIVSQRSNPKKNKIICDAHLSLYNGSERVVMLKEINNNKNIVLVGSRMPFVDIIKIYSSYEFILSPTGAGLDCHRTWEAILAGCIVITRTSPLDEMFIKNKLPVVILNKWSDLKDNLPEKMEQWRSEYTPLTDINLIIPKLTFGYWLKSKN
jgi:hypothetical protein